MNIATAIGRYKKVDKLIKGVYSKLYKFEESSDSKWVTGRNNSDYRTRKKRWDFKIAADIQVIGYMQNLKAKINPVFNGNKIIADVMREIKSINNECINYFGEKTYNKSIKNGKNIELDEYEIGTFFKYQDVLFQKGNGDNFFNIIKSRKAYLKDVETTITEKLKGLHTEKAKVSRILGLG